MSEKITSLMDFIEQLASHTENLSDEMGDLICFRGHSNDKYELIPSLFRKKNYNEFESAMFEEMMVEKPEEFARDKSTFEKLVRMQHYGLPTRLLDITMHPLVALYFACSNSKGEPSTENDGEVIVFKIPRRHIKYSDDFIVSMLSNICRLKPWQKDFSEPNNCRELLHKAQLEMSWYEGNIKPDIFKWVVPVKAHKSNDRIKNQYGLFFLFASITADEYPPIPSNWILTEKSGTKIIIDKDSKVEIRKQLNSIYVSHRTLFPSDLEQTAKILKETYLKENIYEN